MATTNFRSFSSFPKESLNPLMLIFLYTNPLPTPKQQITCSPSLF